MIDGNEFEWFQGGRICDISNEVKDELRKFRFRKDNINSALICEYLNICEPRWIIT